MNVAIAAMIAGRLRRRRRDHAVTRIHDTPQVSIDWPHTRLGELPLSQPQLEKPIRIRNSELLCGKLLGTRLVAYQVPHARKYKYMS